MSRRFPVLLVAASIGIAACGGQSSGREVVVPEGADTQVVAGATLLKARNCTACHSLDGSSASGPTFKGLAGRQQVLTDGRTVTVDDEYLRRSLVAPNADIPKGYRPGVMSNVIANQPELTPEQVEQMIAYIKTVR